MTRKCFIAINECALSPLLTFATLSSTDQARYSNVKIVCNHTWKSTSTTFAPVDIFICDLEKFKVINEWYPRQVTWTVKSSPSISRNHPSHRSPYNILIDIFIAPPLPQHESNRWWELIFICQLTVVQTIRLWHFSSAMFPMFTGRKTLLL